MIPSRFQSRPILRHTVPLAILLLGTLQIVRGQVAPTFSDMVVFGDSLSDVGNIANRAQSEYGVRYPAPGPDYEFNYTDGSFTDGTDTMPAARAVTGVWHEQLATKFLNLKGLTDSLDGGQDFAFGGAKTINGSSQRTIFSEGPFTLEFTIDNMGLQVSDYLGANTPSATTLFIVWGGGNDLFDDPSDANVTQTAVNIGHLVKKLAKAGGRSFLVPNVPPLGMVPEYNTQGDPATVRNQASASYRDALNTELDQITSVLAQKGIQITIYRLDVYSLFLNFIAQPASYGYVNVTDSSQGMAVNPDKYLFWDGIHPTTTGHDYLAAAAYSLISGQPVVSVTAPTSQVTVGDGNDSFYINQIGGDASSLLSIPYTVAGSAMAGVDYQDLKGTRTLQVGQRFAQVKVKPIAGTTLNKNATVVLTLGAGPGYVLGGLTNSTITIQPNN